MSDEDDRNWAEKRIDARRAEKGLPAKGSETTGRWVTAALLAVVGLLLVTQSDGGLWVGLGVVALLGAGYQLIVLVIAQGVREGRKEV